MKSISTGLPIHVFDFFSGCGGTCKGFQDAGMRIVFAIDNDPDSQETFRRNFPNTHLFPQNIEDVHIGDLQSLIALSQGHPTLFSVSAPCQPYTNQNTQKPAHDNRRKLLDEFRQFVEYYLPDYIFLENVPGLQKLTISEAPFARFIATLDSLGYEYEHDVIKAQDYGVPQKRKRLILIASRHGKIKFPQKTHGPNTPNPQYSKVIEWIGDLPSIEAGSSHLTIPNHVAASLSPVNYQRIINTPENGGRKDWPENLTLKCHSNGYQGHTDVYGRMNWNMPASCLTTRCISISNGRFGHPDQNRAISVREAACLQTFPLDFLFFGGLTSMSRQIGNAVPPLLARRFGESFTNHFLQYSKGVMHGQV